MCLNIYLLRPTEMECHCTFSLIILIIFVSWGSCDGFGTFGYDIHHRYSDKVRGILDLNGFPEKGTTGYYAIMVQRDWLVSGTKLAGTTGPLTFVGNETLLLGALAHLHYATVSVGSPALDYLVALDTGSDLFWLPCNCVSCVRYVMSKDGKRLYFNIYSPKASSTSALVSCHSSSCRQAQECALIDDTCYYQVEYLSNGTSSKGFLVQDNLHLITNDNQGKAVDAQITLGCGVIETGGFLENGAPNGLLGLGMDNISVPSILASQGLIENSFSMCFGADGIGRISFGDKGSSGQGETPFIQQKNPTYNVTVTKISLGNNVTNASFTALFDTGTSFTYLNDPVYSLVAKSFNSQVLEKRHVSHYKIPFEYCYDAGTKEKSSELPSLILTMKGGKEYIVADPVIFVEDEDESHLYCLALLKSGDINIIGQNFMTGYNIVFNREKMVLGWKTSDCYDSKTPKTSSSASLHFMFIALVMGLLSLFIHSKF